MSEQRNSKADLQADIAEVQRHPVGTRFFCPRNGKTYQLGAMSASRQFWMLEESTPPQKGLVNASVILQHFEVIR